MSIQDVVFDQNFLDLCLWPKPKSPSADDVFLNFIWWQYVKNTFAYSAECKFHTQTIIQVKSNIVKKNKYKKQNTISYIMTNMETLQQQIKNQIKDAMLKKETVRLTVLRGLVSAFTNESVAKGKTPQDELSDEDALTVIRRQVKQRRDAIEQFTAGGRDDLAQNEKDELVYLEVFLPQMMSEEDVKKHVEAKKAELGITDAKDKGRLMSEIMKDLKGKADGMVVKNTVDASF